MKSTSDLMLLNLSTSFFFLIMDHLSICDRGAEVDVKRLPKRPAPPRFGRKLTDAQKASNILA
jgi:hypothetical protein